MLWFFIVSDWLLCLTSMQSKHASMLWSLSDWRNSCFACICCYLKSASISLSLGELHDSSLVWMPLKIFPKWSPKSVPNWAVDAANRCQIGGLELSTEDLRGLRTSKKWSRGFFCTFGRFLLGLISLKRGLRGDWDFKISIWMGRSMLGRAFLGPSNSGKAQTTFVEGCP